MTSMASRPPVTTVLCFSPSLVILDILVTSTYDGQHAYPTSRSQASPREDPTSGLAYSLDLAPHTYVAHAHIILVPALIPRFLVYTSTIPIRRPHGILFPPPPRLLLRRCHPLLHSSRPNTSSRQSRRKTSGCAFIPSVRSAPINLSSPL